ncbi:MAG: hypothetical protein E7646_02640 [Ruminococcaceae bacterium]|nr:hypothetical protein [Oscillospiraceae bacterium]
MKYLVGADIGTTSLKAAVFDSDGNLIKSSTKDYTLKVSGDRVEFCAEDYFKLFLEAYREISEGLEIAAVAVDTQCETLILTDEKGEPLCDAIVWLDNRAREQAERIKERFTNKLVYDVTGQPEITATWPASKLLWLKENSPEIFEKTKKVFLLEDWIIYKMTGRFVTEKTLQSSSLYFDINTADWWDDMLKFIGIDRSVLPEICDSGVSVGEFEGARVVTCAMDQIAGAIGAGVFSEDTVSEMTGTTMAIFAPTSSKPEYNPESIIPCHYNYNGKFCLLAWTSTAGIALKWFKNNFCEGFGFRELDELAEKVNPGCDGLSFLPYLCGSTMPKYDPDAKGAFIGLTMEHTRAHAVRAILEAVACMLKENLDYMNISCRQIRSMGGGATSPLWCTIKADMTGKEIATLKNKETACLGSAILAGVGAGIFESVEKACEKTVALDKIYKPTGADYSQCYKNFIIAEGKIL